MDERTLADKLDKVIEGVHDVRVEQARASEAHGAIQRRLDALEGRYEGVEERLDETLAVDKPNSLQARLVCVEKDVGSVKDWRGGVNRVLWILVTGVIATAIGLATA